MLLKNCPNHCEKKDDNSDKIESYIRINGKNRNSQNHIELKDQISDRP